MKVHSFSRQPLSAFSHVQVPFETFETPRLKTCGVAVVEGDGVLVSASLSRLTWDASACKTSSIGWRSVTRRVRWLAK
eukprot:291693-Pleurochrysis_carterae.AAC.1